MSQAIGLQITTGLSSGNGKTSMRGSAMSSEVDVSIREANGGDGDLHPDRSWQGIKNSKHKGKAKADATGQESSEADVNGESL